jgi:hypothetical protein
MGEVLKGTGASQLAQEIRESGYNDYDRFELATITAPLPSITVKVDNMAFDLDASDVIIAEHLTEHTRTVSINGGVDTPMVVRSPLIVGDRVIVVSSDGGQTYVILDKAGVIA